MPRSLASGDDVEGLQGPGSIRASQDRVEEPPVLPQPRWFSPLKLLVIFCVTNLFVYLDRGLVASNGVNGSARTSASPQGSGIQGDFDLSFFQDGLLAPAFLGGLLVASPIFAEASKSYSAFRLLGIGMGVWTAACLLSGLAPTFSILMVLRGFVGVGEASFVSLAAPFIDDYAPVEQKATWFAAFFLCIPAGFALGYISGGLIGPTLGWRTAFLLEAAVMTPFVVFALTAQPIMLRGASPAQRLKRDSEGGDMVEGTPARSWDLVLQDFYRDVLQVFEQKVWLLACGAYTLYVAVMGVYAYWGPKAGRELFFGVDSKGKEADLTFGAVTVLTGVLGSIGGGRALDVMGSSLQAACVVCGLSCLLGMVLLVPAFMIMKTFSSFMALLAFGQLLVFLLQVRAHAKK
ncbi:major facilitator superfamily domain-containing protein [Dunaliella salina]|uniref:Major facilitator superfamily domain-containing protein n=1 Tax=Dunaliella salina TaxID=3046 RepID=A0ABQ7GFR3_DUNSA|nr:major facilitator superfamily domain-containing protein [Dunaliella salina]|eukprot:KAF5833441.1 major facilitator superfamily domain-containing protein [Dunaliella salina]